MKKVNIITILFLINAILIHAQNYSDFFTTEACRVDFHLCGNQTQTHVFLDKIKQEPYWGGRQFNLSTDLNLGDYRFRVIDSISQKQIYTDGFSALFREWQTTPEAKLLNKSFEQTIQFPYPKYPVNFIIEKRLNFESWEVIYTCKINPTDKLIQKKTYPIAPVKIILKNLNSEKAIDIAVIAEGYTAKEKNKFYGDAKRLAKNLLSHKPFSAYKNRINVYAVAAPSTESGITQPNENIWKNTAVESHFYTFYEPRYLTTPGTFNVRDYASLVPYDAIYILANTEIYGGGGIYNFYALTGADNKKTKEVTVHEFGHSFAGLGDEYFKEGTDVLDGMYDITKEPWEPNISSLVLFDKKWKKMLSNNATIPTPVTNKEKVKIGVYEGGGYLIKGMYRPSYDCRMRTNSAPAFCPVCIHTIEKTILFLTEE